MGYMKRANGNPEFGTVLKVLASLNIKLIAQPDGCRFASYGGVRRAIFELGASGSVFRCQTRSG
ncbi:MULTISPECIES: hypothetical protein [unclassified Sulfitobacter]|uniref:hypothetical protein n=1 Tax=unclassified Sulfitobacter TaxID=196795 RepID=UPI003745DB04